MSDVKNSVLDSAAVFFLTQGHQVDLQRQGEDLRTDMKVFAGEEISTHELGMGI